MSKKISDKTLPDFTWSGLLGIEANIEDWVIATICLGMSKINSRESAKWNIQRMNYCKLPSNC